ncbi:MAG: ester cyclase [Pseudomonadota bacterium]
MPYDEKSAASLAAVKAMEAGLAANEMDMTKYFTEDFLWRGNQGSGTKRGIAEFQRNWQFPLRAAFTDRKYETEHFMADGDWASCFGHIDALHSGTFMGIPATNKRVKIPYMDFWRIEDGRIADNPVSVDLAHVLFQLGVDVFDGKGWENYDSGLVEPPKPE